MVASLRRMTVLLLALLPLSYPEVLPAQQSPPGASAGTSVGTSSGTSAVSAAGSSLLVRLSLKETVQLALKQNPQRVHRANSGVLERSQQL